MLVTKNTGILIGSSLVLTLAFALSCGGSKDRSSGGQPNGNPPGKDSKDQQSGTGEHSASDDELRSMAAVAMESGQDTAACRDVLASGIFNTHREVLNESATQALRRDFCGEDESSFAEKVRLYYHNKRSSSSSDSSDASFGLKYMEKLELDLSRAEANASADSAELTTDQSQEIVTSWKKKFCSNKESYSQNDFAHFVQSANVAPEVVEAWRDCVTRVHHGFFCSSKNTGDLVAVEVQWKPSEVQRQLLPTLQLKWESITNLKQVSAALPDSLGTGSGKSVGFQRQGLHEAGLVQVTGQDAKGIVNFKCNLPIPPVLQLQYRSDPSCGIDLYKLQRSPLCGVASFNEGSGSACGVLRYNSSRSEACGVELYNERNDAACGVASERDEWKGKNKVPHMILDPNSDCFDQRGCTRRKIEVKSRQAIENETQNELNVGNLAAYCRQSYAPDAFADGWRVVNDGDDWRIDVNCRVRNFQSCRNAAFGVERYHECRDPRHGVEAFNSCRNEAFGVEVYNECRKEDFGVENYRSCLVETRSVF